MLYTYYRYLIGLVVMCSFVTCNKCNRLDCITDQDTGQFRIISKTDGRDLLYGPNAIYNPRKISVYTVNGADTTYFQTVSTRYFGTGYDSVLVVRFAPKTTKPIYIKLHSLDLDTLALTYHTYQTKCCGTITDIKNYAYNNTTTFEGNVDILEIKK